MKLSKFQRGSRQWLVFGWWRPAFVRWIVRLANDCDRKEEKEEEEEELHIHNPFHIDCHQL